MPKTTAPGPVLLELRPPGRALDVDLPPITPPRLCGLSLQVTDACNLACSYCYFYDKDPVSMSEATVAGALDLLEADSDDTVGDWHVNLFGGEPTLHPDLVAHICKETTRRATASGRTASFSMTTNGTRFDELMLELTTRFQISTQLSLDGNEAAHDRFRTYANGRGSYRTILENLDRLRQAPYFKVRLTVSPLTVEHLADSVEELLSLGIRSIATSPVVEQEWTPERLAEFGAQWQRIGAIYIRERLARRPLSIKDLAANGEREPLEICAAPSRFGCGAATTFLFVNAYGDLYPCHRYPGYFDKSPQVRLGSVTTGIDEGRRLRYVTANQASAKKGCHSFVSPTRSSGPCGDCAIQGACGGSCMAVNEYVTGDPTQPPSIPGALEQIKLAVLGQVHEYLAEHHAPAHH